MASQPYSQPPNGGGGPPQNGWISIYERLRYLEVMVQHQDQRIVLISSDNRDNAARMERLRESLESKIQAGRDAHQRVLIKVLWGLVSLVGVAMFQWVWIQMTTGSIGSLK